MPAPQIPNLLSLGPRLGRGRGRARGGPGPLSSAAADVSRNDETPEQARERADRVVQLTDQDANLSRLSAVEAGYLVDEFARFFSPTAEAPRRMPIINRGTFVRTWAIDQLMISFIQSTKGPKQILSLGAGTDTRYFRLAAAGLMDQVVYHEVDFLSNTEAKLMCMNNRPQLTSFLDEVSFSDKSSLHTKRYHLHPYDLRRLADDDFHAPFLDADNPSSSSQSLARDVPTLILSECCLCYLEVTQVDAVIDRLISKDNNKGFLRAAVGMVFYEPIKPDDAFGRVMAQNLERRGIQMPTSGRYGTLKSQQDRFPQYGLSDSASAVDVDFILTHWVTEEERERIGRCEMLDETEEWSLLAQHYCISFGWRSDSARSSAASRLGDPWLGWKQLPLQ